MRVQGGDRKLLSRPLRAVIVAALAFALFATNGYGLNPDKAISQYAHSAWRLRDGFIGGQPYTITQTTDGYIWLGTSSGILRFDGVRFIRWSPPGAEEIQNSTVFALLGTSDGSLWFGTTAGRLWQWKNARLTTYSAPGNAAIEAIVEKGEGKVWFTRTFPGTDSSPICEAGEGRLQCFELGRDVGPRCCTTLATDGAGHLWLGGWDVIRWGSASSSIAEVIRIPGAGPPTLTVASIATLPDNSAWIAFGTAGKHGGLQRRIDGVWTHFHSAKWDSRSVGVQSVLADSKGALWVGSVNGGVYRIWRGDVDHFDSKAGLSGDPVNNLFEDHEGNLWVATRDGIDCFRNVAVTSYSASEGLRAGTFDTVLARRDGTVWTGGDSSLDEVRGDKYLTSITGKDLPGQQVTSLLEDSQGHMWVGLDRRLYILQGTTFTEVKRPDGRSLGMVVGITEDREGSIWAEVSAKPRVLVEIRNAQIIRMLPTPDMPAARKVATDSHGAIWLGLMDGALARFFQRNLDVFRFSDKKQFWVEQIDVEPDGTVLGATGYGLVGWRDGRQQILNTLNGLPCDGVNAFIRDNGGSLWLFTQCGLIRISKEDFKTWWETPHRTPRMRIFDSADGARPGIASFQRVARTPDGQLWFASGADLQMIDPDHLQANGVLPPVHVEDVIVTGKSYSAQVLQHFPPSTRDLSIRYTALSYVAPQKVFFRYMLEGQDKVWQEAGTRREAFYTNLRPGPYRFRVIACNNSGLWNEAGDSFAFVITPAYYQTRWFAWFCAVAFAGLLWAAYLFRVRQVVSLVQGRLGARMEERERIARELHDTLLQGFQGLMLRFQAVIKTLPDDQPAHQMLERVLDRADDVISEGRNSVRDLREKGSSRSELSDVLSVCGEELALGHPSCFILALAGSPRPIEPVVFDEVYRIVREVLINAFQHAKAARIEAEITYSGLGIVVRVRDDGIGIGHDVLMKGRAGHWGFSGMRERARKIDAKLNIWSSSGAGTEVELTIPAEVAYSSRPSRALWQRVKRLVSQTGKTRP